MSRVLNKWLNFEDVLIRPRYNKVPSRSEVSFETNVTKRHKLKIPFIAANMETICESEMAIALGKLGGLGVIHRFMDIEKQGNEVGKVKAEGLIASAAVGVKDYKERVEYLNKAGVDIIVIDIAHGHSKYCGKAIEWIKSNYPNIDVIAGNIGTKDAADYLISKGADAVKVGIGPGMVCTTRENTGVGTPQLTAIMEVYESARGRVPIIADGGIVTPGDVVKALGAGADCVMCGYIFAGCDETPNSEHSYRGSSSEKVKGENAFIEGTEIYIDSKGPVAEVIKKYLEGLASGMTYNGKDKLINFIGDVDFIIK